MVSKFASMIGFASTFASVIKVCLYICLHEWALPQHLPPLLSFASQFASMIKICLQVWFASTFAFLIGFCLHIWLHNWVLPHICHQALVLPPHLPL